MERRKYDKSFKLMAVELVESGKSAREVDRELGIASDLVSRWLREFKRSQGKCFTGNGNLNVSDEQRELLTLKKQLSELKLENEILKKAVSIFSKSDGRSMDL